MFTHLYLFLFVCFIKTSPLFVSAELRDHGSFFSPKKESFSDASDFATLNLGIGRIKTKKSFKNVMRKITT